MSNPLEYITFGIEIECILTNDLFDHYSSAEMPRLAQALFGLSDGWRIKSDSSITADHTHPFEQPVEIISPPLKGYTGLAELKRFLAFLSQHAYTNDSCGGHVHIGIDGLFKRYDNTKDSRPIPRRTSPYSRRETPRRKRRNPQPKREVSVPEMAQFVQNLTLLTAAFEDGIFTYSGGKTRQQNSEYCRSAKDSTVLGSLSKEKWQAATRNRDLTARHRAINVTSLATHQTVEFRLFAGSVDPTLWITNILVAVKLATAARDNVSIPRFLRGLSRNTMHKLFSFVFGAKQPAFLVGIVPYQES